MEHIEIPTMLFWENGNSWYGSLGSARFFIKPEHTDDTEEMRFSVRLWRGPLAMDLSEIIDTATFPLTQEGLDQTTAWLEARAAELNR